MESWRQRALVPAPERKELELKIDIDASNWKLSHDTKATILGLLLAVGIAVKPFLQTGKISWSAAGAAAVVAAFGYVTNKAETPST